MSTPTVTPPPQDLPRSHARGSTEFNNRVNQYIPWQARFAEELANAILPWLSELSTQVANDRSFVAGSAADAGALLTQVAQSLADQVSALRGASSSSNAVALGAMSFTVAAELAFSPGSYVNITTPNDASVTMAGRVTDYASTTLEVEVLYKSGSGTFDDWRIDVAGAPGAVMDGGIALQSATVAEQSAAEAQAAADIAEQSATDAQAAATEASGYTENAAIRTTRAVIESDATLAPQANGFSVGPVTVADGVTVTLLTGATWSII